MVFSVARRLLINDLVTIPGLVVVSATLHTVHVSNIVSVVFLKFITINVRFFRKLTLPEGQRFVHSKTNSFQEKTELQPAKMFEMVVISEGGEKRFGTGREILASVIIQISQTDLI